MEMTIVAVLLFLCFAFGGVGLINTVMAEDVIQGQAQQIAMSEGHYGGCTTGEASLVSQYINDFCQKNNTDTSQASVSDNNPDDSQPVAYGKNITVSFTVPYNLQVLGFSTPISIPVTLTGEGRSVSSYIQGMTPSETYTAP